MRIREAQKHNILDPTDPDPQHCLEISPNFLRRSRNVAKNNLLKHILLNFLGYTVYGYYTAKIKNYPVFIKENSTISIEKFGAAKC